MRQTPGCRDYRSDPVPDDVVYRVLDAARFAPSGGNRQGWRVAVVRDPGTRLALRDLYQAPWREYVRAHYGPPESMDDDRKSRVADADRMAASMHEVPVHLLVWLDMSVVAVTDAAADRPSVVAGGSVFPFVQNLQLAARDLGLGTRITTLLSHREDDVRALVAAPSGWALAALVLLGWPVHLPSRLSRRPVERFTWRERFDGESFNA
jgi:hypothetical protein